MKATEIIGITSFVLFLLVFRIFLGIQINFIHLDYEQIYLMGLENAFSGNWSFWGPDVVWSKTRLPGAMQGLLAGIPLRLTNHPYSPIVLSNLISAAGLILLSFYAKRKFPGLSLYFLLSLFLLFPFGLFNGVVLLNTSYLIFSGAILFLAVFDLFVYRDKLYWNSSLHFFMIGFSLLFTYQLHLGWVLIIPFVLVLLYLEWKRTPRKWWKPVSFLALGSIISGLTLLPTLFTYGNVIMTNVEGNLTFKIERTFEVFDLFARYLGMATFDIIHTRSFSVLASDKSIINLILIWAVKLFTILQFIGICISLFFIERSIEYRKTILLFFLTLIMALFLYIISNKHLEARTYILLYPIPIWLTLFSYSYLIRYRYVKSILNSSLILVFVASLGIGISNFNDKHSFKSVENKIQRAIEKEDPYEFAKRRKTLMDDYN